MDARTIEGLLFDARKLPHDTAVLFERTLLALAQVNAEHEQTRARVRELTERQWDRGGRTAT